MKRFLAFVLIAMLGVLTLGCESKKDSIEHKTQTTTTQTKDGKTVGETTTVDSKTETTTANPDGTGKTTEKTTETTTETHK